MTEAQLIQSSQQGVTSCFAQLVALYQPRLLSFLLVHCQNREDAEDALQEAFINAFRYINSYHPQWKFSTWLFTIARRAAIKKQASAQIQSLQDCFETDLLNDLNTGFDAQQKNKSKRANVWLLIRPYISQESFHLLWFFYVEELSLKELAEIFEKTLSWVKVNLHRSREKLAKRSSVKDLFNEMVEENDSI